MSLLELVDVDAGYGKSQVLFDVSLSVGDSEVVSLIGRNGAGKTTTIKTIAGIIEADSGEIRLGGEDVVGLDPYEISRRGISTIPETRRLIPDLTVRENIKLGRIGHQLEESSADIMDDIYESFPRLADRVDQKVGQMSGGEQQMVAIARGLVSNPDLVLIDEPTEGLMPSLVEELHNIMKQINESGTAVLLVEQNAQLALDVADRGYLIDEGHITTSGDADKLRAHPDIAENYIGL